VDIVTSEPERAAFSTENCSVARTLALVGEKWTLLLLRETYYGTRRFTDFQARLGLARNLLTARLQTLVDGGLLTRVPYRDPGHRTRHEYRLTDAGRELFPVLVALLQWGDTHLADADGPSVVLQHRDCGQPVHAVVQCTAGHRPLVPRDVRVLPGPGARRATGG
jgi:DNA-binding HxlR family transcriptional regulator